MNIRLPQGLVDQHTQFTFRRKNLTAQDIIFGKTCHKNFPLRNSFPVIEAVYILADASIFIGKCICRNKHVFTREDTVAMFDHAAESFYWHSFLFPRAFANNIGAFTAEVNKLSCQRRCDMMKKRILTVIIFVSVYWSFLYDFGFHD